MQVVDPPPCAAHRSPRHRVMPRFRKRLSLGRWKRSTRFSADDKAHRLRDRVDADPRMSDQAFFEIVAALMALEPPRRACRPSGAVSKEARIATYGERYDRGEELWNERDAIHGHCFREQIVKVVKTGHDGIPRLVKRIAIFDATGEFIAMGRI